MWRRGERRYIIDKQEQIKETNAFIKQFTPYQGKHGYRTYSSGWKLLQRKYLTNESIQKMIHRRTNNHLIEDKLCKKVLAYYANYATRIIGVDIDCHNGESPLYIDNILQQLRIILPKPSLTVKTPRGMHVYWVLDSPFCLSTLTEGMRQLLISINLSLEIIPSSTKITRMPSLNDIIYPETKSLQNLIHYNVNELITPTHTLPSAQRARIVRAESTFKIIEKGQTNEALCYLIPIYRSLNLSPEQSYKRIISLLSPTYTGDFPDTALERIYCFYKNYRTTIKPVETVEHRLYKAISTYLPPSKYKKRKVETIYNFAKQVANHIYSMHSLKENKQLLTEYGFKYPGSRKHLAKNEIPIPSALLKTFNKGYTKYMKVLIDIGFLSPTTKYSTQFRTCKYFNVKYTLLSHKIDIIPTNASNYDKKFITALEEKYSTNSHDIAMFRKYSKHYRKNEKKPGGSTSYKDQQKIMGNKRKTSTKIDSVLDEGNKDYKTTYPPVSGYNSAYTPHTTFYNVLKSRDTSPMILGYYPPKIRVKDRLT